MIKRINEGLSDDAKDLAKSALDKYIPKIRDYIKGIENELDWAEEEFREIVDGEVDDVLEDSYVSKLAQFTKNCMGDMSLAYSNYKDNVDSIY